MISACNSRDYCGIFLKNKGGAVSAAGNDLNREGEMREGERDVEVMNENY